MNLPHTAPGARSGRRSLRARVTWSNTAVFAAVGCVMLVLNWLSVRQLIEVNAEQVAPASVSEPPPPDALAEPSTPAMAHEQFARFRADVLDSLGTRSVLLLTFCTILAALLCWWTARRSLRRISHVTAAARRINDGNLHDRLGLDAPDDEVKHLGDTFDAMLDRLERAFGDQRRFTAHASHELRTPLTLQRAALEIPLAQGRVPADLEPALRRSLAATTRCEHLLEALLTLARGESGMITPRPADLAGLTGDALNDVHEEAADRHVTVHSELRPAPTTGDPVLLAQLVFNLLTNAIRHNHKHGTVRVTTRTSDELAVIEVTNTGPVIGPAELSTFFRPFQRGPHAPTIGHRGSGLGLTIVQAITNTHRGHLHARPHPHGGLTVRVALPTASGPVASPGSPTPGLRTE
ncbi:sensor histidine kinase [Streptomyces globisporus]|uniref:sensor histidine kinase n=1 Tax=Streptomyces globisporus TaxID=1908 RepID=UPI0037A5D678